MEYLGWIVFAAYLLWVAYLLYSVETAKPSALRQAQAFASADPEVVLRQPRLSPPPLPEQSAHFRRISFEAWWTYS